MKTRIKQTKVAQIKVLDNNKVLPQSRFLEILITVSDDVIYVQNMRLSLNGPSKSSEYRAKQGGLLIVVARRSQLEWNLLLDAFGGFAKSRHACIRYLMDSHYAKYTQAENAVDNYRKQKGLTRGGSKWPYLMYNTFRVK